MLSFFTPLKEEEEEKIFKHSVTRHLRFVCPFHLKTKNSLVVRKSGVGEYLWGRWTPTHTQINNWVVKKMSAAKGNIKHCVKMNEHSYRSLRDEAPPMPHPPPHQRASSNLTLIAPSNDIVRQAARAALLPILAQIRVRYRHLLVALTPVLLERRRARSIKSAKRIAPSSSSFAGNKEQWVVIQPRNESGDGGGAQRESFFADTRQRTRKGLNGFGIKAFTLVSFRILIFHVGASPDINIACC